MTNSYFLPLTHTFSSSFFKNPYRKGLTAPGAIASFKVYVMTTTGNENGGKAVKIVRPVT